MWAFMYGFLKQFENIPIVNEVIYMGDREGEERLSFFITYLYIETWKKTQRYMHILLYNLKTEKGAAPQVYPELP